MAGDQPDYAEVFESLSVPYALLDRSFRYVAVNQILEDTVARPRNALIGHSLFELFPEVDERQSMIEDAFRAAFDGTPTSMAEVPYSLEIPGKPGQRREIWWTFHCTPIPDAKGDITLIGFHAENITREVEARNLKDAIARELQHRISNTLSLVQVIARQTAGGHPDISGFLEVFDDRIHSLARTHQLLTGTNWDGLTFDALLSRQLEPQADLIGTRITLNGPALLLSSSEAQALSMAVHELTTNALKHGALSIPTGHIAIDWTEIGEDGYRVRWTETGLTDLQVPTREGFGTAILTRILPAQIGGKANQRFTSDSHVYEVTVKNRRP